MSMSSNPKSFAGARTDPNDPNSGGGGDSTLSTLLNANNLDSYVLPAALSVTVARSFKQSYPVANTYDVGAGSANSRTISFVLTPGADYVYGPDSFFTFSLTSTAPNGTTRSWFGEHGSALNIFKSIRLTHASGTELEYIDHLNILNQFKVGYDRDESFRASDASGFGQSHVDLHVRGRHDTAHLVDYTTSKDKYSSTHATPGLAGGGEGDSLTQKWLNSNTGAKGRFVTIDGTATKFVVPLSVLSEFFNSDKLLPPYVLAGMRIEIELESPNLSMQHITSVGVPIAAAGEQLHTVTAMLMQLDSHTLTDSVAKSLSRMSANDGLDIHFPSWFHDRHNMTSNSSTINITKALSRVEDIQLVPRVTAEFKDTLVSTKWDSLCAKNYETKKWQISIGSMFFPSHPVESAQEAYRLAIQGRRHMARIGITDYVSEGMGVLRGAMERSQILNGSGIAISATRGATISITEDPVGVPLPTVDLFVKHTRLVSVFLDNVVVRT